MTMTVKELLREFQGNDGKMGYGVDTAMKSLRPHAVFVMNGMEFLSWDDPTGAQPPSWQEISDEFERHKKISNHYQYVYDRAKEYPHGYEQLEMIWDAINSGIDLKDSEWFKTIQKIKEKHPKPEGPAPE